ncbi:MAG: hypothetical protein MUQ32_03405, partial [Chloroflexi bacterium]|nr:hypothetical protein [Chloroflexota bacterium]
MRVLAETGAFREALGHGERALELWSRVADASTLAGIDHVDLLAFAARMAGNTGRPERAVAIGKAALQEVDPGGDPARAASLLVDLWSAAWEAWDEDVMGTTVERMAGLLDALPPTRLKAHVLYLVGYHHSYRSLLSASVPPLEGALAIARAIGDERMVAIVASALASSLVPLNRAGRAAEMLAGSELSPEFYDATPWPFWAAADQIEALWGIGRFHEAVAVAAQAIPIAARYGLDRRVGHWLSPHLALFVLGRIDEAVEVETRAIADAGGHGSMGQGIVATCSDIDRGQLDRARHAIELRRERDATHGMIKLGLRILLARAEGHLAAGREAADEGLERAAHGAGDGNLFFILGDATGSAADAAVIARRRRRVDDLARAQADGRRWMERLRALADEARADGGAGDWVEATLATAEAEISRLEGVADPAAWVKAVARWAGLSHVYWTAYARFRLGEALLATDGERATAAAALRDAREAA